MAGVALHKKIIELTDCKGSDQGHRDVIHLSFSHDIGDRTEFLLGNSKNLENPGLIMADLVIKAIKLLDDMGRAPVVGVPCNTFHAPAIFDAYTERLLGAVPDCKIVDMLKETIRTIKNPLRNIKKVGMLSTTGTRATRVWNNILEQEGIEVLDINEKEQEILHACIYDAEKGLKAVSKATPEVYDILSNYILTFKDQGADAVVLGCTELPLAFPDLESLHGIKLIDPVVSLAKTLVRESVVYAF